MPADRLQSENPLIKADVTCVWPARAILGEGPWWDARSNSVFWVDIKGGRLHAFDIGSGLKTTWTPPQRLFSLASAPAHWTAPHSASGSWFVGCAESGFAWILVEGDAVALHPIAHPEPGRTENRFNDGKMGPDGRYWAGTMHDAETESTGSLYAFAQSGEFERVDTGYIVSNGPAFSPDGRTLYHTDSARQLIYAFDLDTAARAGNRRVLIQFGAEDGFPDGMTTDRAGNLWIAMWDGARLQKLSASGARLGHVPLPMTRPTSCVFTQEHELFVTSASIGAAAADSLAGGLFRVTLR